MKGTKAQKGITLVALIITIVVLLILASVAIGTVRDSDIIGYAQNAVTQYEKQKEEEELRLEEYKKELDKNLGNNYKIGAVNYQGKELQVGDFIMYGDKLYAVLHNDDIEGLQIVATEVLSNVTLKGIDGFENRVQILKNATSQYINKEYGAIDSRVLGYTFNDIKKLEIRSERNLEVKDENDNISLVTIKVHGLRIYK